MITDEMLREAAHKASVAITAYYERNYDPEKPLDIPPEFEKKIERLKRRAEHPVLYKTMHRVASIILAILITGGAWITFDAEARAAFVGWVKEIYETYFVYHFEGDSKQNESSEYYRPTLLPSDYTEFYSDATEDTINVVYANEEGEMLKFSYCHNPDNTTWFVGTDQLTVEPVTINGVTGEIVTSTEPGSAITIMWITEDNTAFNISGFLSVEDLVAAAESVQIIKN